MYSINVVTSVTPPHAVEQVYFGSGEDTLMFVLNHFGPVSVSMNLPGAAFGFI